MKNISGAALNVVTSKQLYSKLWFDLQRSRSVQLTLLLLAARPMKSQGAAERYSREKVVGSPAIYSYFLRPQEALVGGIKVTVFLI